MKSPRGDDKATRGMAQIIIILKNLTPLHLATLLQVDAQLQVVRKLEEKEHLLQSNIGTGEKELGLRTQALEMNKRKVKVAIPKRLLGCLVAAIVRVLDLLLPSRSKGGGGLF